MSAEKIESLIKLYYHLITTAYDSAAAVAAATAVDKQSTSFIKTGFIALAGYEGLGFLLSKYSSKGKADHQLATFFELVHDSASSSGDMRILFAVPMIGQKRGTRAAVASGTMGIRHVCTIALKTTIAIARFLNLCLSIPAQKQIETLNPSSYGSLGRIVSDLKNDIHRLTVKILQDVHLAWIKLLATTIKDENDTIKEILGYNKGAHRALWDCAAKLQEFYREAKLGKFTEEDCLEIRKQAILLLLAETSAEKVDMMTRKAYLESACTYAWKAATVFAQYSSKKSTTLKNKWISEHALSSFYKEVDEIIQRLSAIDQAVPLGYVEYFAYKSLHTTPVPTRPSFAELSLKQEKPTSMLEENCQILLDLLKLAVFSKSKIDSVINLCESDGHYSSEQSPLENSTLESTHCLIESFHCQYTQRLPQISPQTRSRIFKIFSSLSLPNVLFVASKEQPSKMEKMKFELQVAAEILICIGNFAISWMKASPEKSTQLIEMVTECHTRPLSVYEKLNIALKDQGREEDAQKYLKLADLACASLCEIVTKLFSEMGTQLVQAMEKVAKVSVILLLVRSYPVR
jgi:hypothetical protein